MTATHAGAPATTSTSRVSLLRDRLLTPLPQDQLWGWIGPLLVTAFGAFLRFNRLSVPNAISFDETYYAKDAWSLLHHGVEFCTSSNKNLDNMIAHGYTNIFATCSNGGHGEYIVQPPVGKWLIAIGEWMFGLNSFGWRFSAALIGTLSILLFCRIARRLTRSTLLGCVAGLLLSLDGLEFVLSRTGILDIFLMFFVLAAFGCMLIDRDVSRARLAEVCGSRICDEAGPHLGIRWWRVAAGVMIGLACAVKWDACWYMIAFVGLALAWDMGARRTAGLRDFIRGAVTRDGVWLPLTLLVIPVVTYVVTWTGWLVTSAGYDRNYAASHGVRFPVVSALYSLFQYHKEMFNFGVTLHAYQPYMSQPWGWAVLARPIAYYYACYTGPAGGQTCPSKYSGAEWSQEVIALGNPAIWWGACLAMVFCLGWWLTRRDWRAGAALLGVAAGWLTWFPFVSRTKFYYYALEYEPFMILCIVLCLGLILGPATASFLRRSIGASLVGAYLLIVLLLFGYFYPILAGQIIPYGSWLSRMWFHGWI